MTGQVLEWIFETLRFAEFLLGLTVSTGNRLQFSPIYLLHGLPSV